MSTTARTARTSSQPTAARRYSSLQAEAERLGVSAKTLRRLVVEGKLTAHRLTGTRVIRLDPGEVDALFTPTHDISR